MVSADRTMSKVSRRPSVLRTLGSVAQSPESQERDNLKHQITLLAVERAQ
jgi:hypothetical protein